MQISASSNREQHWSQLLAATPGDEKAILDLARSLSAQGRAEAAEELLESACAASPDSFELLAAQADLAARNRDWALSEARWRTLTGRYPESVRPVTRLANALRQQKQYDVAEKLLATAVLSDPSNQELAEALGYVAQSRADWNDAERRWAAISRRFPSSMAAHLGLANARLKLHDLSGAEAATETAVQSFPADPTVLDLHARVAVHAQNWPEAEQRWDRARRSAPQNPDFWCEQASAMRRQGRKADAHILLKEAAGRFSQHRQISLLCGELAGELGLWPEASAVWNRFAIERPEDKQLQKRAFDAAWRAIGSLDARAFSTPAAPAAGTSDSSRSVMLRFEAFGNDDEFALVQRHYGAEPISLLRWANISTEKLIAALDDSFEGLGTPETTKLAMGSDYKVRDRRFGLASHTWVTEDQTDREKFFKEQCRRLQYLRRNLLEDIEDGQKILVYKNTVPEPIDDVKRLYRAIRKHGPATLLYVRKADSTHPAGTLETLDEGLLVGYLENLYDPNSTPTIYHADWISLCRQVLALVDGADPASVDKVPPDEVILRFESLGNNCEFGSVQRRLGAEPLGLLRWSSTRLPILADAFEKGLPGIGDPENTELYTELDFRAVDTRYGLSMQTFVSAAEADGPSLLAEQCRRMRFLRRQLLTDLRSGQKIFVHKTARLPATDEIQALYSAVRRHGPSTLFHIRPAAPGLPDGHVERAASGLLIGYMDRLVAVGAGLDVAYESWLTICRSALKLLEP